MEIFSMIASNFSVPRCCNIFLCYIVDINYMLKGI